MTRPSKFEIMRRNRRPTESRVQRCQRLQSQIDGIEAEMSAEWRAQYTPGQIVEIPGPNPPRRWWRPRSPFTA